MKINNLVIRHLQIPMRLRFAQANNTTSLSDSVIVQVETESGITGYGECCPRTYVTGESVHAVTCDLESIKAELFAMEFTSIDDLGDYVCLQLPGKIGLAAICGVELALLDAFSREVGTPLVKLLGGSYKASYDYTGIVPFGNIDQLKPVLSKFQFGEVKLKVDANFEKNAARITAVRNLYGPKTVLRLDANCAWRFAEALEQTKKYAELGISCIEQPFPSGKDEAMAFLTQEYGEWIDIMADESLTDYSSAWYLIEQNACTRFNIKLSKNGGVLNSLRIYRLAQKNGMSCQLGAHFGETSLLTAAGLVFASVARNLQAMEGGLGLHLLEEDICERSLMMDHSAQISGQGIKGRLGFGLEILEKESVQL